MQLCLILMQSTGFELTLKHRYMSSFLQLGWVIIITEMLEYRTSLYELKLLKVKKSRTGIGKLAPLRLT